MKSLSVLVIAAAMSLAPVAGPALAAGDAAQGAHVALLCRACHSLDPGRTIIGPSLHGLFGRKAGSLPDFSYSEAMKTAGADGLVWNEETLTKYLTDPKSFIPGNKMAFLGISDPARVADLIAYLKQATK